MPVVREIPVDKIQVGRKAVDRYHVLQDGRNREYFFIDKLGDIAEPKLLGVIRRGQPVSRRAAR